MLLLLLLLLKSHTNGSNEESRAKIKCVNMEESCS